MARKKSNQGKFFTEGMTVQEILNISPDQLARLSKRDISRALRTVSLAANKRINRLLAHSTKTKEGYTPKKKGSQISTKALNWVTNDGKQKQPKFGVKKSSTRNEMISQLKKAKQFMEMETSTISGAVKVRKDMEKRLFGKTREQASRGKSKREKARINAQYEQMSRDIWSTYRKFLETEGHDPHSYMSGSDAYIDLISNKIVNTGDEVEALQAALDKFNEMYESEQEEYNDLFDSDDFWSM